MAWRRKGLIGSEIWAHLSVGRWVRWEGKGEEGRAEPVSGGIGGNRGECGLVVVLVLTVFSKCH